MKTNILISSIAILLTVCTSVFSQGWERVYPDFPADKFYTAKRVLPANDGGYHVLVTESYIGALGGVYFMMKIDSSGQVETTATFGNNAQHIAYDMIETSNGEFVILSRKANSGITFLRLDDSYNLINQLTFGDTNNLNQPRDIFELPNGEFWMTGRGSNYPASSFLQKLDPLGQPVGTPTFEAFDYFYSIRILPYSNGGASVVGYGKINDSGDYKTFIKNYDNNGVFVNEWIYEDVNGQLVLNDIIITSDGGFLMACNTHNNTPVLIKTDADGAETWRQEYMTPGFLIINGVRELPNGSGYRLLFREQIFDLGSLQHAGLIDTDSQGNWVEKKDYSKHYFNEGQDLILLPDNGTLIAGQRHKTINNPWSPNTVFPYLVRTDSTGNTFYSAIAGKVENDDNDDCQPDSIDLSIGKFVSAFQDGISIVTGEVDSMGNYEMPALPGTYKLAVNLPNFLWSSCQDSLDLVLASNDTIYNQDFAIAYNNEPLGSITGYVFEDHDNDCFRDSFETIGYEGWIVHLTISEEGNSLSLQDTTDNDGYYAFTSLMGFTNGANTFIYFEEPIGTGLNCGYPCWQEAAIGPFPGTSFEFNNGVHCDTLPFCPIMSVALATDEIRPCTDEQYYVSYCNIGGTTAADAYLEVTIDSALTVTGSSVPWDMQSGNVYTFELGDLLSNECGTIQIDFFAPCDDTLGTTYCSEVYAYPDTTCVSAGPEWDGSEIELSVECLGDSVIFYIQNIGTGDMTTPLEYIVIEDNVLLNSGPQTFQLASEAIMEVVVPVNGFFYRMSSQQPEGFPGLNTPIVWIEGCGDSGGTIHLGLVNQYPLGDEDTWEDVFCLESTNSFDPNDKNGFPRGVGDQHFIDRNEPLEYIIRFQNTGTAEALYVEIRDTIPVDLLDPVSIRPGAASHPYTWDMEGNGIVVFKFENIDLPPENADPEASKGFVQFKVEQREDLPVGTEINNTAAIYFDNNLPVITNQTWHIIGEDYLPVWIKEVSDSKLHEVLVFPNPVKESLYIELKGIPGEEELQLEFFDVLGNRIASVRHVASGSAVNLPPLSAGSYFIKISKQGELIGVRKIVKF